jgi:hypothetical protein
VQICGVGCFAIGDMAQQLAQLIHSFVQGLQKSFRGVPIVVQMEAQPAGWANVTFRWMKDLKGVYFLCDGEGAADSGFGIRMSNRTKMNMGVELDALMRCGLRLAPNPFLLTNVTDFRIRNQITPTTADDFIIRSAWLEMENFEIMKDPRTGNVSISGKRSGRDDDPRPSRPVSTAQDLQEARRTSL